MPDNTEPKRDGSAATDKSTEVGREVDRKGGRRAREAGIACKDAAFINWAKAQFVGSRIYGEDNFDEWVRVVCGVGSRVEFDHNENAAREWDHLWGRYHEETGRQAERRE